MQKNAKGFFKKIILFILSLTLVCGAFAGCGGNDDDTSSGKKDEATEFSVNCIAENAGAYVWGAPDTVSIMQDVGVLEQCDFWGKEWLENSDKLECEGIKGDTEAVQVMMTAKKDVASFNLTAGDLTLENGDGKILSSDIEVLAERYIETKKSSAKSDTASEFLGWYADALVPMAAYKARRENKITKGNNQGVWVNINIPSDAAAGTYKGNFTLDIDGERLTLPVSVKVYDVEMPTTIHARTAFDIWFEEISNGEDPEDADGNIIDWGTSYYDFIVSKRLNPQTTEYMRAITPNDKTNFSKLMDEIEGIARNERLTSFRMPYSGKNHSQYGLVVDYDMMVRIFTEMVERNIQLLQNGENIDLFKKAFFYFNSFIDEPQPNRYEAVRYCDRAITQAKQAVAPMLSDYPEVQKSLMTIPNLVTGRVDFLEGNEDEGGVQTWTAQSQQYTAEVLKNVRAREQATDRYSFGEGFWIYMTMESNNPYPSLQLDDNLLSPRSLFWMNQCYGIQAILYWCVCYYSKAVAIGGDSTEKRERNVWSDPNSYVNVNGDAYLLYPGSRYGLTTPISTLRLESLRQGSEDYEYIYLLENAIDGYNAANGTNYDLSKIMARFYNDVFVPGSTKSRTNLKKFGAARSELLGLLDAVVNDKPNAGELLSGYQAFNA